ncbi:MAG: HesA/MoeB/ThiF family protein [Candidatus Korarchaeum sp.]|nr:HesA/MoeB/ThiF family protein [Candidatus Korarchaeum sp.]MDW8035877.1 HesA/MoeB/ThiF family protein [Candidatus Korarchaeum sp.]
MSRYERQLSLIGEEGQVRLRKSLVAIVGAGGIGSPLSLYLASAGVNLRIIDGDLVGLNNLHRQIIYGEDDVGLPKALVAEREIRRRNSDIEVEGIPEILNVDNIGYLLKGVNLVMDASDNFKTRYIINDYCIRENLPFVYSAINGFYFAVSFIIPNRTACLRCLFPSVEDSGPVPVIGMTPAVVALIAAAEAVKYLAGLEVMLAGKLLIGDLRSMEFTSINVSKNKNCPVCGK